MIKEICPVNYLLETFLLKEGENEVSSVLWQSFEISFSSHFTGVKALLCFIYANRCNITLSGQQLLIAQWF